MNFLPLVTIAVRFLGLVLVVAAVPRVFEVLHRTFQAFLMGYGFDFISPLIDHGADDPGHSIGWFVMLALGLYMFLSGRWFIARLTRGLAWPGGGTCHKCGYDVTGVEGSRCPECGTKLPLTPEQVKR